MSFGIKHNPVNDSLFNCFTCKRKGNIVRFLESLSDFNGEDYTDLIDDYVGGSESLNARLPSWEDRKLADSINHKLGPPISDEFLDAYDSAAGHPYLHSRGISDDTALDLGLRVDPEIGEERIMFPVYAHNGDFYGCTSRATNPKVKPRIKDYFGLPKRHLLLGSHLVDKGVHNYVILVEGLFDFARLYGMGFPAMAVMHSGLTRQQAKVIKDISLPVYVLFDNDDAGMAGQLQVRDEVGLHVPLRKVRYPKAKTFSDGSTGEIRAPVDPCELAKSQVERMMEDSRLL